MKNITLSVVDELNRQARIKAVESSTSVSAMFKAFLLQLTSSEQSGGTGEEKPEFKLRRYRRLAITAFFDGRSFDILGDRLFPHC